MGGGATASSFELKHCLPTCFQTWSSKKSPRDSVHNQFTKDPDFRVNRILLHCWKAHTSGCLPCYFYRLPTYFLLDSRPNIFTDLFLSNTNDIFFGFHLVLLIRKIAICLVYFSLHNWYTITLFLTTQLVYNYIISHYYVHAAGQRFQIISICLSVCLSKYI